MALAAWALRRLRLGPTGVPTSVSLGRPWDMPELEIVHVNELTGGSETAASPSGGHHEGGGDGNRQVEVHIPRLVVKGSIFLPHVYACVYALPYVIHCRSDLDTDYSVTHTVCVGGVYSRSLQDLNRPCTVKLLVIPAP